MKALTLALRWSGLAPRRRRLGGRIWRVKLGGRSDMKRQETNAYFLRRDFPLDRYAWYAIDTDGGLVSDIRKAAGPANRAYVVFSDDAGVINKAITEKELCGNDAPRPAFTIIERAAIERAAC